MNRNASRRSFLAAAGLALPAAASASRSSDPLPAPSQAAKSATPAIEYRVLGKTGLKVTTVGFGCMITSDGSVIERAADMGITYFDTARVYQNGNNERMVGAALKNRRKSIVLSSKSGAHTRADALANLDTSLKELGTDYLDIWYLHAKEKPEDITDELIDAQQTAKQAGKIRFAGVSTHKGQPTLIPFLAAHPKIDVILSAYNFTLEPVVTTVLEQAAKAGKGTVAMKVMAGGFRRLAPTDPNYQKLKQDGGMLSALKWVVRNPSVSTTIPSMTDIDQLEENIKAMAAPFGHDDEKRLAAQLERIGPLYCRMCGACQGQCRQGLPVEDMLRFVTYAEGYGQFALGREHFLSLAPAHVAASCGDCVSCTVECPHGVKVPERLLRAQELFRC
ncbi:MAG: aldo/keto reductase [Bryobacteraceae bacterium]|jgi:aryl-alcohol dehydrogenase-like predicted oxidoreductase